MKRKSIVLAITILSISLLAGCGSAKKNDEIYENVVNEVNEHSTETTSSTWDTSGRGKDKDSKLTISSVNGQEAEAETEPAEEQTPTGKPDASALYEVDYVRTIDGDTLEVSSKGQKFRVRLIGIDTPESVHPDASRNTDLGVAASTYTKTLLDGTKKLYLQYGTKPEDNYNRKLCYVWLRKDIEKDSEADAENYMLNAKLCKAGMAVTLTMPPNIDYAELFIRLVKEARESGAGLWAEETATDFSEIWVDDYENYENGQQPMNGSGDEEMEIMDQAT